MPHVVSGMSHVPDFVLWAVVGLLCSQVTRMPGKGWLTIGFLLLSARSLLYIVSSGQPFSDSPAAFCDPFLVVGAIGCCLIGVLVGGASQVAASASLPGVGGWWSGLPWFGKAAIGLAIAGPVVGVLLLVSASLLYNQSVNKYRSHYDDEDYPPSIHKSDEDGSFQSVPPDLNGPDRGPPTPEADVEARHNEANRLEMQAADQLQQGNKFAAKDAFGQAAQIQSKLTDEHPDNPNYRYEAAVDYRQAGDLETDVGTIDAAISDYTEAQNRLETLVHDYPDRDGYKMALLAVYDGQVKAYTTAALTDKATDAMEKAGKLRESLPKDPNSVIPDKP